MFFGNGNCGCPPPRDKHVYIPGPQGPQGAQGRTGATGEQGPQGPQGLPGPANYDLIANFYNQNATNITTGAGIPFDVVYNFDTADISHTDGTAVINLNEGYYHITYIASAQSTTSTGVLGTILSVNGVTLLNSISVTTELNVGNSETVGASFILQITAPNTPISLLNGTEVTATYNHINLIIKKLNVRI